jgi:hypothetical protein
MSGPAEVVATLARLGEQPPWAGGPLTPQSLIDTYCKPGIHNAWESETRAHSTFHAGFCGCDGEHGYEDGYALIVALEGSGWRALRKLGPWPLTVFMVWPARSSDPRWALAHYCEADFAIEVFDCQSATGEEVRALHAEHAV